MKRVVINGSVFALVFLSILYSLHYIVEKGLRKSKMQYYASWNDIYGSKINADVIICGDSRAKLTYSPKILDSVLGTNSYNIGINGAMLPLQLARLKIYLQHNKKPKYIIHNVDFYLFGDLDHLIDYEQFLPYLDDTVLRNVVCKYGVTFTTPELYFPLFRYNNHLNLIKEGIFCYFNIGRRATNNLYKGYAGVTWAFNDFFEVNMKKEPDDIKNGIGEDLAAKFRDYLGFCKANGIQVIFVYAPVMKETAHMMQKDSSKITQRLMTYADEYKIPFLIYFNDSMGYHRDLFIDHVHMNTKGSELFSRKLAYDLKNIIRAGR